MCARYSLTAEEITMIIGVVEVVIKLKARYNIAHSQRVPVILKAHGRYVHQDMAWGWNYPQENRVLVNAKSEHFIEKAAYMQKVGKPMSEKRCLIPADGFYEWLDKKPIRFTQPDNRTFCFAGTWLMSPNERKLESLKEPRFVILTTTPNKTVSAIHDRMPFIVHASQYQSWLDDETFQTVLQNPDQSELDTCPVQPALNDVRHEGPDLIRPYTNPQKDLF